MKWLKIASVFLAGIVLAIFALIGFLFATRDTPARTVYAFDDPAGPPAAGDSSFLHSIELLTQTELNGDHSIEILLNGDGTYPRIWQDLRAAQRSIIMHLYYWKPGAVADSLKRIISLRARAGVRVLVLLDAFGAQDLPDEYLDRLKSAGVRVAEYRPLRWYTLYKAQHRSHMRLIVIDDRIGYTGGFGIADQWLGDGRNGEGWRDTNLRFTGPALYQMKAVFAILWAEATGQLLTGKDFVGHEQAAAEASGGQVAGMLYALPTLGSTAAERFLILSLAAARARLYIATSYFVPTDDLLRQLTAAAARGVDVRVLTAGKNSDVKTVRHAGHARYAELLRAGVRIYEYQPTMMHTKSMVVDGRWSTVGTMNFDNRSLAFNDESNLLVADSVFGAALEQQFYDDLRYAREFKLDLFRRRSVLHKLLDGAASLIAKLL
ncbi:MAG: phospholipase D-like domain-containing protein [Gemmatimonadota bacterium]